VVIATRSRGESRRRRRRSAGRRTARGPPRGSVGDQQLAGAPACLRLAQVARAIERELPRARLRVVSIEYLIANDALTTGVVDACFTLVGARPRLPSLPLYREAASAIVRRDHPFRGEMMTRSFRRERPKYPRPMHVPVRAVSFSWSVYQTVEAAGARHPNWSDMSA
jgi:hypothetical protein